MFENELHGTLATTLGHQWVDFSDFTVFATQYGKRASSASVIGTFTLGLPGDVAMEFVRIESGTFTMGTTEKHRLTLAFQGLWQEGVFANELPAHEVTITRPYMMGRHEVTRRQWDAVMGKTTGNPSDTPAVEVSWEDVQGFIVILNSLVPVGMYRLPTEAEWEYGCRGGTETLWACGDLERDVKDHAWYHDPTNVREVANNSGGLPTYTSVYTGAREPQIGGGKDPNPWGLCDMHGNVAEWVQDWYSEGYYEASPSEDPPGPSSATSKKVVRGGAYRSDARSVRSARREALAPSEDSRSVGLRLVREVD